MKLYILLLLPFTAALATAGERTSANYSILVEALDSGGAIASSAGYRQEGSAGLISGMSKTASGDFVAGSGYIAQVDGVSVVGPTPTPSPTATPAPCSM